jgi:hypothetical protein
MHLEREETNWTKQKEEILLEQMLSYSEINVAAKIKENVEKKAPLSSTRGLNISM